LASAVPSRWQTGQEMGAGMRPSRGQTSKEYFWPQAQ